MAAIKDLLFPMLIVAFVFIIIFPTFIGKSIFFVYLLPVFFCLDYRFDLGFFSFTVAELAIIFVWSIALVRIIQGRIGYISKNMLFLVVLVALLALPSVFLQDDLRHALSLYRDFIGPSLFLLGFLLIGLTHTQVINLIKISLLVVGLNSVLGIIQYQTGKFSFLYQANVDQVIMAKVVQKGAVWSQFGQLLGSKAAMATGMFANGNGFGEYLIVPLVLLFAASMIYNIRKGTKAFWIILLISGTLAMLFTYGRAALISGLLGIALFVMLRKASWISSQRIIYISVVLIFLVLAVYLSGIFSWDNFSTLTYSTGRIGQIKAAINLVLLLNPSVIFFGGGTGKYFSMTGQLQTVHHFALNLILYFGLPVFLIWLTFIIKALISFVSKLDVEDKETKYFLLAIFCGLLTQIFIYQQTTNSILSTGTLGGIYYWLGVGIYLHRFLQRDSNKAPGFETNSL